MKIYDGAGMILGRLASAAAKDALLGEDVNIVNCEKVVISGTKVQTFARQTQRFNRGGYPLKSQDLSRLPDRFVRRIVRGMLPWKVNRGKEAWRRVMCYIGVPPGLQDAEKIRLEKASVQKLPSLNYVTVGEICKHLGGKI
ncbi:50S ribosomal protein L13 [Candidatus Woesearchaeota archaeon]|nr:50S ribosomal protein L13 [Candidatus Woesearchaeota archaeon]